MPGRQSIIPLRVRPAVPRSHGLRHTDDLPSHRSLTEVGGDGELLIDPADERNPTEAIEAMVRWPDLRADRSAHAAPGGVVQLAALRLAMSTCTAAPSAQRIRASPSGQCGLRGANGSMIRGMTLGPELSAPPTIARWTSSRIT